MKKIATLLQQITRKKKKIEEKFSTKNEQFKAVQEYRKSVLGNAYAISVEFSYPREAVLLAIYSKPIMPSEFVLLNSQGDGKPEAVGGEIVFTAPQLSANPIYFNYTLNITNNKIEEKTIKTLIEYWPNGSSKPESIYAEPNSST